MSDGVTDFLAMIFAIATSIFIIACIIVVIMKIVHFAEKSFIKKDNKGQGVSP